MRFFFRSRQFKIILAVVLSLAVVSVTCFAIGGVLSPQANIISTITAPIRSAVTSISNSFEDFFKSMSDSNELMLENAQLESEINTLHEQLKDYQQAVTENEFLKDYLEIKDKHNDFKFEAATLISRDNVDPYKSFVIDKGSVAGVEVNDPVITDAGLVGYITEVGLTTSKVTTILNPKLTLGALSNRTNDSGVVSGVIELAEKNEAKFYNLARNCSIAVGDYVITSGEGIFPKGLLIGAINSIGSDEYNTSIYANIKIFADLDNLRNVMVITDFAGQGGMVSQKGE